MDLRPYPVTVLIRGVGDVGSAVARRLFIAGYAVVVHDSEQPTTTTVLKNDVPIPAVSHADE